MDINNIVVFFHAMNNRPLCSEMDNDCILNVYNTSMITDNILQQSVNQVGMMDYKKEVEKNFKDLKASLAPKDKESVPKLPQNQKEW